MRWLLAVFCSALALTLVHAGGDQPDDVVAILMMKAFWNKAGAKDGRTWTDAERKQLADLKSSSKDPVVRLRANKVLVDLAENSRYRADDEVVVVAGFRYLEAKLKDAPVRKLCVEKGFTHYAVSSKKDGSVMFRIEHVAAGGFNGGLNLSWDAKKQAITGMQPWGAVPAR